MLITIRVVHDLLYTVPISGQLLTRWGSRRLAKNWGTRQDN